MKEIYRTAPAINSWGLSGWEVEGYTEILGGYWYSISRWYWTKWGAERASRQRQREYEEWIKWNAGWQR